DMMEENRAIPVVSNEVENWPQGPVISARSAILMDADTGAILYNKDSHVRMYPASTTKLMTSLLVMEHEGSSLNDLVEISSAAVDLPWDASTIDLVAGDKITLEECLYAILVCSANEVSNAVAEYVSGDIDSFVKLMNKRAKELGCTDTTFEDAHGYSVNNHMTTAYDLALIAKEAFKNELLCKMARTPSYHWYPTEYQAQDIEYGTHNLFLKGTYECEGLVGSKTGFTDESRQVLVTAAERNGMRLIAVVMQEETPNQYIDTLALFDYGFANFQSVKVSEVEKRYSVADEDFFHSDSAVFGDSTALFSIDKNSTVIVPKTTDFTELSSSLVYDKENPDIIGCIYYSYHGIPLGKADVLLSKKKQETFAFDSTDPKIKENEPDIKVNTEPTFIYVNYIVYAIVILFVIVFVTAMLVKLISNTHFAGQKHKRKRKKPSSSYLDL
nr:D-alanyl-D-alanine carboxypeptidase [Lachnospiraceae bacterium]